MARHLAVRTTRRRGGPRRREWRGPMTHKERENMFGATHSLQAECSHDLSARPFPKDRTLCRAADSSLRASPFKDRTLNHAASVHTHT